MLSNQYLRKFIYCFCGAIFICEALCILRKYGQLNLKLEIQLRHSIVGGTVFESIFYSLYPWISIASGFLIFNNIKNKMMISLTIFCLLVKAFAL